MNIITPKILDEKQDISKDIDTKNVFDKLEQELLQVSPKQIDSFIKETVVTLQGKDATGILKTNTENTQIMLKNMYKYVGPEKSNSRNSLFSKYNVSAPTLGSIMALGIGTKEEILKKRYKMANEIFQAIYGKDKNLTSDDYKKIDEIHEDGKGIFLDGEIKGGKKQHQLAKYFLEKYKNEEKSKAIAKMLTDSGVCAIFDYLPEILSGLAILLGVTTFYLLKTSGKLVEVLIDNEKGKREKVLQYLREKLKVKSDILKDKYTDDSLKKTDEFLIYLSSFKHATGVQDGFMNIIADVGEHATAILDVINKTEKEGTEKVIEELKKISPVIARVVTIMGIINSTKKEGAKKVIEEIRKIALAVKKKQDYMGYGASFSDPSDFVLVTINAYESDLVGSKFTKNDIENSKKILEFLKKLK